MNWSNCLNTFMCVATSKSFTHAADLLALPQSTVSKHIQWLEDYLDTKLLTRTSRTLSLTDSGSQLYLRSQNMLAEWESIREDISHHNQIASGIIRIDTEPRLENTHLKDIIKEFLALHPGVRIYHRDTTEPANIENSGTDIYMGSSPPLISDAKLVKKVLGRIPRECLASQKYIGQHGEPTHPNELTSHACISYRGMQRWELGNTSYPINVLVNTNSPKMLVELIADGVGIGYVPKRVCQHYGEKLNLTPILTDWPLPKLELSLYYIKKSHVPKKIKLFVDYVTKRVNQKKLEEVKKFFTNS